MGPIMIHPFKTIRNEAEPRLSINRLAFITNTDRWVVIRTEQGLYTQSPDAITMELARVSGRGLTSLYETYYKWQIWKRKQATPALRAAVAGFNWESGNFATFLQLAFPETSRIAKAKLLCVHPATLQKYELKRQQQMPAQIMVALTDGGLTPEEIDKLSMLGSIAYYESDPD